MKKNLIFPILLLCMVTGSVNALPPVNLSCAKARLVQYYETGAYEKDVDIVVRDAEAYLQFIIKENASLAAPRKLAMVLDIDDTSISHYQLNKRNDFSLYDLADIINTEVKSPAVKPVLRLYNQAVASGVAVYFISSRPESARANIISNLQNAGYAGWAGIYLTGSGEENMSGQAFKTSKRQLITSQGYEIVLNIGDQDGDIDGGYARKVFKLPNPMYSSSRNPCVGSSGNSCTSQ